MRSIEDLRDYLHAPVEYDRARNGYYLRPGADGPWELPGLWFNASELHALLAAHELLANVQPGLLDEALAPLRSRIEHLLQSREAGGAEIARRVRVLRVAARAIEPKYFRQAADAVIARRRVRIVYHGRGRDQVTTREISPQRLVHYRENWYLDAWDHGKRALRSFAVERIREIASLDRPARDLADSRLDAHFASAYGIFSGRPKRTAVLRFTPERARWVADEQWHPSQTSRLLPNGAYELRVPYADARELILDILRYGPDVEVLGPPSLRHEIARRLALASKQYIRAVPKKKVTTNRRAASDYRDRGTPLRERIHTR
ncbi:MAG: helix-turn-helix transcriptional regulator [Sulfurifustis sp.]